MFAWWTLRTTPNLVFTPQRAPRCPDSYWPVPPSPWPSVPSRTRKQAYGTGEAGRGQDPARLHQATVGV